jgi:hypothetical protein
LTPIFLARCAFRIEAGGHSSNENEILKLGKRIFNDMVCTNIKTDFLLQLFFLFPGIMKVSDIFGNAANKLFR